VRVLLVDWGSREPDWSATLQAWREAAPAEERPDIVLFGPHTDLAAHAAAREAGLGPMRARSALVAALPGLLRD
jgi:sirohydrochlorin ferrochelatase